MLRKILVAVGGVAKGLVDLAGFLFFLLLILLPLAAPPLIEWQGSRLTGHAVEIRSVFFNPFVFRLTVNGFSVSGGDKRLIAFNKLWVNAGFLDLFKREIRVQSAGIDGLEIQAELLPGGRLNLLDLIPQTPAAKEAPDAPAPAKASAAPSEPAKSDPPAVFVDSFVLSNGAVRFADRSVEPNFETGLTAIDLKISGIATVPESQVRAVFLAVLGEKGSISLEAAAAPLAQPLRAEAAFEMKDYNLQTVAPYVGKYAGRGVKDGRLDVKLDYTVADNRLRAGHKVLVQRFDFGDKVESKDALDLPFGLVVGLLEDPEGRIDISLPVKGDIDDPEFEYLHLLGQVARNFVMKIVTKPLVFLASAGGAETADEESGFIRFAAGSAEMSDESRQRLSAIVKGLQARPRLSLEINGSYDPVADWQAMRARTYAAAFAAKRAESTRPDSALIKYIYEDFFGFLTYGKLAAQFKDASGGIDQERLDAEAKRRLLEEAPADAAALDALAAARAKLVYEFMVAEGFDGARLSTGPIRRTQSSMGQIPLEFTLAAAGDLAPAAAP